jgi:beta-galactosidase
MWKLKYSPGTIEARGFKGGQQVLAAKRETPGPAARILLRADRNRIVANGEDVACVTVEVVDAQGRQVSTADNEVEFQITGAGKLLGVGNGDPSSHESDKAPKRRAFNGLCMAIVQALKTSGDIQVQASSAGLTGSALTISASAVPLRPSVSEINR